MDIQVTEMSCLFDTHSHVQTLLKLNGDIDQFPVGYEISGVVTKGTVHISNGIIS